MSGLNVETELQRYGLMVEPWNALSGG